MILSSDPIHTRDPEMADARQDVFGLQTSSYDPPSDSHQPQEHCSCYEESDLGTKYGERSSANLDSLTGPPPASLLQGIHVYIFS